MILYHWRGDAPNFGDELNTLLWPRLLPNFFDDDAAVRFLGIGSILEAHHPLDRIKVVAGAGYGGYYHKPIIDQSWIVHWVRGPLTAAILGLPTRLGLGDPAMLLPLVLPCPAAPAGTIGFMPHFENLSWGAWEQATARAGVTLIDPRDPPPEIITAIGRCCLLLSESLHGAIVADALRVPWVALKPLAAVHRPKWRDWAETVGCTVRPQKLAVSTAAECCAVSRFGRLRTARDWIHANREGLNRLWPDQLIEAAARTLRRAVAADPQQSTDVALDRCQARMMEAIETLRRQPMRGRVNSGSGSAAALYLHSLDKPEYELGRIG